MGVSATVPLYAVAGKRHDGNSSRPERKCQLRALASTLYSGVVEAQSAGLDDVATDVGVLHLRVIRRLHGVPEAA